MLEKNRADNVAQGRRVGLPSQSKTSTICDQSAKRDLDEELTIRIALIEDYDRMIRIILLTTISCTHLDIVHSSQYV